CLTPSGLRESAALNPMDETAFLGSCLLCTGLADVAAPPSSEMPALVLMATVRARSRAILQTPGGCTGIPRDRKRASEVAGEGCLPSPPISRRLATPEQGSNRRTKLAIAVPS